MTKNLNESVLTTVPVMNPHAPAPQTGRQTLGMFNPFAIYEPLILVPF